MKNGPYELVVAPEDYPGKKYRDRYCYEHHLSYWRATGEVIKPGETIHHKNEQKLDNEPGNLEKMPNGAHASLHHPSWTHGHSGGYKNGCRCELCVEIQRRQTRDAVRRWRAKNI